MAGPAADAGDANATEQLPPPLTTTDLVLRVNGMSAASVPTKQSVANALQEAQTFGGRVGELDNSLKHIIGRCLGKTIHMNFSVTLPASDGRPLEAKLQLEYATGEPKLQTSKCQKEKILLWCTIWNKWAADALVELGPSVRSLPRAV